MGSVFTKRTKCSEIWAVLTQVSNKNHGCRNTGYEVLPEVNYFCNQQLPYHKTQHEDILIRNQSGFDTQTGLSEHKNIVDNPIS